MDEVHGVADVLEHAPEGHEEVAVVVTIQHAGGRGDIKITLNLKQKIFIDALISGQDISLHWVFNRSAFTHFLYLEHLEKKLTRQA